MDIGMKKKQFRILRGDFLLAICVCVCAGPEEKYDFQRQGQWQWQYMCIQWFTAHTLQVLNLTWLIYWRRNFPKSFFVVEFHCQVRPGGCSLPSKGPACSWPWTKAICMLWARASCQPVVWCCSSNSIWWLDQETKHLHHTPRNEHRSNSWKKAAAPPSNGQPETTLGDCVGKFCLWHLHSFKLCNWGSGVRFLWKSLNVSETRGSLWLKYPPGAWAL